MTRILTFFIIVFFLFAPAFGETAREYFKFAKFNYDSKEYQKALVLIDKAIAMEPNYVNGLLLRAEINYGLNKFTNVVDDVTAAFELDIEAGRTRAEYHLLRGDAHYQLANIEDAITDIDQCIKINPENAKAYFLRAEINIQELKYFEAVENFDLAIKYDADESNFYLKRAEFKKMYYKPMPGTKTYQGIMNDIKLAAELNTNDYRPYKLKCDMLKLDKKYKKEDLIEILDGYIEHFPEQAVFYSERGLANVLNYNYGLALKDFTKAIQLDGQNEANYRNRGVCFHNMKKYQLALNDYTSSIKILINKYQESEQDDAVKRLLAQTFNMRGMTNQYNGNSDLACDDYYNAAKLGSNTGLNNYRKNCNVFN